MSRNKSYAYNANLKPNLFMDCVDGDLHHHIRNMIAKRLESNQLLARHTMVSQLQEQAFGK